MDYEVQHISMSKILSDDTFNCRGEIPIHSIMSLMQDIQINKLQSPIIVQPISDVQITPNRPIDDMYDYRIIAGHRRFLAVQRLGYPTIPAMIRTGLGEASARIFNLTENIQRADLNLLQEAEAVRQLCVLGLNQENIGQRLSMSRSWVAVRIALLKLPKAIQEEAAAGVLTQTHIKQLAALTTDGARFAAIRQIKDFLAKGLRDFSIPQPIETNPHRCKKRTKTELEQMMAHLMETIGPGLPTRVLAWASGNINSAEFFFSVRDYAVDHGLTYQVPL